jgi:hypothetical protein
MKYSILHSALDMVHAAFMEDLAKLLILFGSIMLLIGGALLLAAAGRVE